MLSQDVHLSVRLSITRQYSVEAAKHYILEFFPPLASHTMLVFLCQTVSIFRRGPPNGAVGCTGYEKKSLFSTCFISEMIQNRGIVTVEDE